jgi:ATP-dependent RNA helicase RhlE
LQTTFESLGLGAELVLALTEHGFAEPTALQEETIQNVLAGRDLLALAGDGAGRTLAYGLPVLQQLRNIPAQEPGIAPRALFLMPTRDLAARAEDTLRVYAQRLELTGVLIQGGVDYSAQVEILKTGVDVVVATTGRLLDHVAKGTIDLSRVRLFAIDAADRLTDIRFQRDILRLLEALPPERQTLLFATTVSDDIRAFAAELLKEPVVVELATVGTAPMPRASRPDSAQPRQRNSNGPPRQQGRNGNAQPGNAQPGNAQPGNTRDDNERRAAMRDRQPASYESSLFPSSGPVFGYGDGTRNRRPRSGPRRRDQG